MPTKELKQIWNSVVAVATIAVAILEQRQRKFYVGYLQNCDLQFPNLTYACPRLPFILIFSYKRSTHHKEMRVVTQGEKHKETKEKQDSRERLRAAQKENLQKSIGNSIILILFLLSHFLFIYRDVFHG